MHTISSSFQFPIIIYHCKIYQLLSDNVLSKRKNESKKRPGRGHIKINNDNMA